MRELWNEFAVARRVARQRRERDVQLAWMGEWMARQKTLSGDSMRVLLGTSARKQRPQEQLAVMHQIAALTGRPVQFRPARR